MSCTRLHVYIHRETSTKLHVPGGKATDPAYGGIYPSRSTQLSVSLALSIYLSREDAKYVTCGSVEGRSDALPSRDSARGVWSVLERERGREGDAYRVGLSCVRESH